MPHPSDSSSEKSRFQSIWRLAWPQMLMMLSHFFIGFVDVLVAGRIHSDVQASLGIITQCLFFFLIIGTAVAGGTVSAVSQSLGAGLRKRAQRYTGLSFLLAALAGVVFFITGMLFKHPLLSLLHIPEPIRPVATYFLDVYLAVLPGYYVMIITNAVFRAYKWVHIPLFTMTLITIVNTICDFGLGLGLWGFPDLGYRGVAWATFFSILSGALFNVYVLHRKGLLTRRIIPPLCWIKVAWRYLFKVAWPAGAMQVLWQTAAMVVFAITASLPVGSVTALAGMTAGLRIEAILFLPGFAFNMTASILIGHILGQGDPDEAKRVGYRILAMGCGAISLLGILVWWQARPIVAFLAPDPAVQVETLNYLFYNILAIPFTVASMILGGIMIGAGATIYNLVIFGVSSWCIRLPVAYLLGLVWWKEASGIWISMLISQIVQSTTMLLFYQFGNWRRYSLRGRRNSRATA